MSGKPSTTITILARDLHQRRAMEDFPAEVKFTIDSDRVLAV